MTKSKKKILILLTLVIFFIFSNISKNFITNNQSLEFNEKDQVQIKQSGTWDLTGSPIYIDDLATGVGAHNWTWAETQPWCSGSGSWAVPYIIENVTIDGQVSGNCIEIKNSDAYFIIRNCTLYNSGYNRGINLDNVDNGKIINNTCSDNNYYGIYLYNSDNNTISGNTANNNYRGIYLDWDSNNNTISGNTANNNDYGIYLYYSYNNTFSGNLMNFCGIFLSGSLADVASHSIDTTNLVNNKPVYYYVNELGLGSSNFMNAGQIILINCSNSIISGLSLSNSTTGIYLSYSDNNTLSGNTANNNLDGIYLDWDSNNNTLSGNTANNNYRGIYLDWDSDNNTLSGNTANNNDYGIYLGDSDNNTLSGNTANNNLYGIYLGDSNYNTLLENIMNFCGISLSGSLLELASHIIDDTNLVNNKPVYYYVNELGLGSSNFTDAGQIILINCNNSIISGFNLSNGTTGIYLYDSNNNTLSGNTASNNNDYGIYLKYSNNNNLSGNTANNNFDYGIYLYESDNSTLSGNTANNNFDYGIYLYESDNSTLSGNTASNNSDGIHLLSSHYNTISNNSITGGSYGIEFQSSHYNTISNNSITGGSHGIEFQSSHYNTISNNNVSKNKYGMYIHYSNYNNFTKNSILNSTGYTAFYTSGGVGIYLYDGNNNSLWNNTFSYNDYCGIYLNAVKNVSIKGNHFERCGLVIGGSLNPQIKYDIDQTNLVNNKPLYFYLNKTNLNNGDFINAGQILLVNCNDSLILDLEFSYCSSGISLWNCFNNTIFNNAAFNLSYQGISIYNCNNISVSQNNVSNCIGYGISIGNANQISLTKNFLVKCSYGILTQDNNNTIISNNIMINNTLCALYFIAYSEKKFENVTITGNIMNGSGLMMYYFGDLTESSFYIDKSNLVNGKILYFYFNKKSLTNNNFTNAGQIYMNNCSDISFSDLDLSRSTIGLMLYKCNNLTISNIDSSYNFYSGVMISNCNKSKFSEVTIKNCSYYGFFLSNSHDIIISNSNIIDGSFGCYVSYCSNITLAGNYFNNNMDCITMQSCSNSILINNTINNSKMKFSFGSPIPYGGNALVLYGCSHNNFTGNNILNSEKSGIHFYYTSNNNTFLRNIIANNSQYGIYIDSFSGKPENNAFFLNNFINNGINAEDNGYNNRWDDGFAGNYWDDYSGVDINPIDGIGDTSYLILGTAGNYDFKPLVFLTYEDTDGDGLTNYEEYILGDDQYRTNVTNPDSDYDLLSDYWEWGNLTDPWDPDCDDDNLSDWEEVTGNNNTAFGNQATNPWNPDTDGDGLNDTAECTGSENLYQLGVPTNPNVLDTDGDGLNDTAECLGTLGYITNANLPDTDFDNMPDGWEVFNSLNPLYDDAYNDPDLDLLENIYEYHNGTDPQNNDTDSDGMLDGWEVINGLLPLTDDSTGDPDGDNLINVDEFLSGTNPHNDDTDSDTFLDGIEVSRGTDPLNKWWYPMPNLAVIDFRAEDVTEGLPFVLDFTIINNGIWRAEGIILIIRIESLDLTLYENIANPLSLDEDENKTILSEVSSLTYAGQFILNITIDPGNLINETYSLKNGNLRENWKTDNSKVYSFRIIPGGGDGGLDVLLTWIIIGIILVVAITASISFYLVVARPKLRRRAAAKRLIKSAKDDVRNFEINIRSFVKSRLKDNYKSIWWEEGVPEYIKQVVDNKINALQPKKLDTTLDKIDFFDFTHYNAIITDQKNWEPIFSDIFSDKTVVETNLEGLNVFKRHLYDGNVTPEEMSNYTLFIYTISSYFAKGFNIFLSYSTLDTDYFRIREVAKRLESYPRINKVLFWEEDSQENIVVYMEKTLQISKVFVFFCSQKAVKSKAVADEWQAAFQMRKKGLLKIVPVYEKEELIPNLLMPLLNVKYTKDDFDGFIQKLYDEILR